MHFSEALCDSLRRHLARSVFVSGLRPFARRPRRPRSKIQPIEAKHQRGFRPQLDASREEQIEGEALHAAEVKNKTRGMGGGGRGKVTRLHPPCSSQRKRNTLDKLLRDLRESKVVEFLHLYYVSVLRQQKKKEEEKKKTNTTNNK